MMGDYVTVPRVPTEAMLEAGESAAWDHDNSMPAIRAMPRAYAAMVASAPASPARTSEPETVIEKARRICASFDPDKAYQYIEGQRDNYMPMTAVLAALAPEQFAENAKEGGDLALNPSLERAGESGETFAQRVTREMVEELDRRRVVTLARLGLMLSKMAGGEAAEVIGFDAAELYAEVQMALGVEDADEGSEDIALEIARDHPEGQLLGERFLALPLANVGDMREALEWYGEQARLARLIHSEGDAGRHALADDGGKRARKALAGDA